MRVRRCFITGCPYKPWHKVVCADPRTLAQESKVILSCPCPTCKPWMWKPTGLNACMDHAQVLETSLACVSVDSGTIV